jgi:hypothetical protein
MEELAINWRCYAHDCFWRWRILRLTRRQAAPRTEPGWPIDEEFRPPLANELFGFRGVFAETMASLDRIQPIIPHLRWPGGKNVETVLRELQIEADEYPERRRQLGLGRTRSSVSLRSTMTRC